MVGCAKAAFHPTTLICREMGIPFPKPFILEMDNEAARIFAEGTCKKSKMKHIDCRQLGSAPYMTRTSAILSMSTQRKIWLISSLSH